MRYPVDAFSVIQVFATLGVQFAALYFHWSAWTLIPIVLLARQVNLVEHNHAHLRIFNSRLLNDALGWLCWLSNGVPLEFYELHHVKNHHRFNNGPGDCSSMFGFAGTHFPDKPVGRAYYIFTFPLLTISYSLIEIARNPGSRTSQRFVRSVLMVALMSAGLIAINPMGFLVFFFSTWIILYFGLGFTNYRHHHGCAFTNPNDSSMVFFGLPYGLLGFNIGYHVSHHIKPELHWSLLPQHHEQLVPVIPKANFWPAASAPANAGSAIIGPPGLPAAPTVTDPVLEAGASGAAK